MGTDARVECFHEICSGTFTELPANVSLGTYAPVECFHARCSGTFTEFPINVSWWHALTPLRDDEAIVCACASALNPLPLLECLNRSEDPSGYVACRRGYLPYCNGPTTLDPARVGFIDCFIDQQKCANTLRDAYLFNGSCLESCGSELHQDGTCHAYFRDPDGCAMSCINLKLTAYELMAVLEELTSCLDFCDRARVPQNNSMSSTFDTFALHEHFECLDDCTLPMRAQIDVWNSAHKNTGGKFAHLQRQG